MTMHTKAPKPATKQEKKGKRNTSGNSASKRKASAPAMMSIAQAKEISVGELSENWNKIDTSKVDITTVPHVPKEGAMKGKTTLKLELPAYDEGERTAYMLPETYAVRIGRALEHDAAGFILTMKEYMRNNPNAN